MPGLLAFACFGISAALLIAALSAFLRRRRFEKLSSRCTARVLSIEKETERSASGGHIAVYMMQVQYRVQDADYCAALRCSAKPRFKPGDALELLYDTAEPGQVMPASGAGDLKNTLALLLFALALMALGLWLSVSL